MIKLVAFDWNGTLYADTSLVVRAVNEFLRHFGCPLTDVKEYRAKYTIPIKNYWVAMGLDPDLFDRESELIEKIFLSSYEPLENKARSRTGAREMLRWLRSKHIKTIIYSNHIVPHIQKQLKRLKLDHYIDAILARELGDRTHLYFKHKDDKLGSYVRSLLLKPAQVLTVGDTDEEIEIGKKFGYHTVALTGGYQNLKRLRAAYPDFIIHNLLQLKTIIKNLNGS